MALDLLKVLDGFDSQMFPGSKCGVDLCVVKNRNGYHAQYCHPRRNARESYTIFIPGLKKSLEESKITAIFRERGQEIIPIPEAEQVDLSLRNKIVVVAAHEVRHRMQFCLGRKIKPFNPWTYRFARSKLLRQIGKFVHLLMKHQRVCMRRDRVKASHIRKCTNSIEFDSNVIELLAIQRLRQIKKRSNVP